MKLKSILCLSAAALMSGAVGAATRAKGDCIANAIPLGATQQVKLVNGYDPEFKENTDSGVAIYSVTLKKNQAYTIWITGGNTADITQFSVDVDWTKDIFPFASFDYDEVGDGATKIAYLYADSWDEEDENSYKFYVEIDGEIGQTCSLYYTTGIKSFVQEGEEGNPRRVTMTDNIQHETRTQIEGDFYYSIRLEAGRKYRLWAIGATEPVFLTCPDDGSLHPAPDPMFEVYYKSIFGAGVNPSNAVSYVLYPDVTADYVFDVGNGPGSSSSQLIGLAWMSFAKLTPEQHMVRFPKNVVLTEDEPSAEIQPGRLNSDAVNFYDDVIDETLCKIWLAKGERWVFETTESDRQLLMRAYDSAGTILAENTSIGNGDTRLRTAVQAQYDGWHYVGVCDPSLNFDDTPSARKVRISAVRADTFTDHDDYDHGDDEYPGASMITAYPGAASNAVIAVGKPHGPHTLNGGDWYDWFCFAARGGATYALKASFADIGKTSDLQLAAQVWKMVNGKATQITTLSGSLTPYQADEGTMPLVVRADEDAMYYVRVSVKEGVGLDYPAYNMHAMGYFEGLDLGLMQVKTLGTDATWNLVNRNPTTGALSYAGSGVHYPNGAMVLVPANTETYVILNSIGGYKQPLGLYNGSPAGIFSCVAKTWTGTDADEVAVIAAKYTDVADPGDDTLSGYLSITPTAQETVHHHTFWTKDASDKAPLDPADMMVFKAVDGRRYNFTLTDATAVYFDEQAEGDAVFSIYSERDLEHPIEGLADVTHVAKRAFEGGVNYLIKVTHASAAGSERDTCYDFAFDSANVGQVGILNEHITVTKNDAYAELEVVRTASEGAVKVWYSTIADTAVPGEDYYPTPTNCILSWAAGDASSRKIRIRLIPDAVAKWSEPKAFKVKIWPFDEDTITDPGEYAAEIATIGGRTGTAIVTINPCVAKNPGTITVLDQPLQVVEGEDLVVRLARTGGTDGRVAVAVTAVNGSAASGADFDGSVKWVDWAPGDDGVRTVTIKTVNRNSAGTKDFYLSIGALQADYRPTYPDFRDCDLPKLAASRLRVVLYGKYAQGTTDVVNGARAAGVSISVPRGSWHTGDIPGGIVCDPVARGDYARIQFTVDGPGFFEIKPYVENGAGSAGIIYQVAGGAVGTAVDGQPLVLPVKGGRQNILVQLSANQDGGSSMGFWPIGETGLPFRWTPLSEISAVRPAQGAVIPNDDRTMVWTKPAAYDGNIWYRAKVGTSSGAVATLATEAPTTAVNCMIKQETFDLMQGFVKNLPPGGRYRFYWRLECAYSANPMPNFDALEWLPTTQVWSFDLLAKGSPSTLVKGRDAMGKEITTGEPVRLVQGVNFTGCTMSSSIATATISGCVGGQLPPGLSASNMRIVGVPREAGDYVSVVEVAVGSAYAATETLNFSVEPMDSAAGDFLGICDEDGSVSEKAWLRTGLISVSARADGAISGSISFSGGRISFSTNEGYESVDRSDDRRLFKRRIETPGTVNGIACTHALEIAVDADSLKTGSVAGSAKAEIWLADPDGVPQKRTYACALLRNNMNADSAMYADAVRRFAGYYTVAAVPVGPRAGDPLGNTLLTLTVGENGSVKMAGILADGTSVSSSAYGNLVPCDAGGTALAAPVYASAPDYSFGGILLIRPVLGEDGEKVNVIDSTVELFWSKDGVTSTADGLGFALPLLPSGGWYDTVVNLQRHYLDRDFSVEAEPVTGLPAGLLPSGYGYVIDTMPRDLGVELQGNALSVPAQKFVMETKNPSRIDFAASINPWALNASFNRANGLMSGNFKALSDNRETNVQAYAGTCEYRALLLMNRDEDNSRLDDETLFSGFYLFPVNSNWKLSMPFGVRAMAIDPDFSEGGDAR